MGRAGVPFEPWRGSRQYLSKRGYAIFNGTPGELDVHLAVVDDTNGELCREIAQSLLLVSGWNLLPAYETWTPDRAELEIQKAITRMTLLCDALERGEEPTEAAETGKTDCHPLSPPKENWPREEYARDAIIRLRETPALRKNVSGFCKTIAEEQGVPEIATSLRKLLYESEYKELWKL